MYERFTPRARKVMQLANQEAHRFRHEYVGTEHILLGLVQEGSGIAANVLKKLDVDLRKIRKDVEKIIQAGPTGKQDSRGRLPQTPRTKKVIDYAVEEARDLNHNYVGTEHLILGLMREEEGVAAQVLTHQRLKLDEVREEVLNLLARNLPTFSRAEVGDVCNVIPKALKPAESETYSVSDLMPENTPTQPEQLTASEIKLVQQRIRALSEQFAAAVAEKDVAQAGRFRDEREALKLLLAWYQFSRGHL